MDALSDESTSANEKVMLDVSSITPSLTPSMESASRPSRIIAAGSYGNASRAADSLQSIIAASPAIQRNNALSQQAKDIELQVDSLLRCVREGPTGAGTGTRGSQKSPWEDIEDSLDSARAARGMMASWLETNRSSASTQQIISGYVADIANLKEALAESEKKRVNLIETAASAAEAKQHHGTAP